MKNMTLISITVNKEEYTMNSLELDLYLELTDYYFAIQEELI